MCPVHLPNKHLTTRQKQGRRPVEAAPPTKPAHETGRNPRHQAFRQRKGYRDPRLLGREGLGAGRLIMKLPFVCFSVGSRSLQERLHEKESQARSCQSRVPVVMPLSTIGTCPRSWRCCRENPAQALGWWAWQGTAHLLDCGPSRLPWLIPCLS